MPKNCVEIFTDSEIKKQTDEAIREGKRIMVDEKEEVRNNIKYLVRKYRDVNGKLYTVAKIKVKDKPGRPKSRRIEMIKLISTLSDEELENILIEYDL